MEREASVDAQAALYDGLSLAVLVMADIRERFLRADQRLRGRPEVQATRTGLDCRSYNDGPVLELYLEADVPGRTLCWWLEARTSGEDWQIDASVLENRDDQDYQNELRALPTRVAADTKSFVAEFTAAADALLATAEQGEFLARAI